VRRRDVYELRPFARQFVHIDSMFIDRRRKNLAPIALKQQRGAAIAGRLNHHGGVSSHEHMGREIQTLLATRHDHHLLRRHHHSSRWSQETCDQLPQFPQARRVAVFAHALRRATQAIQN